MQPLIASLLAAASLTLAATASAAPTVLDFDDIAFDGAVPAGYGGLDWSASSWYAYSAPQQPYSAHSGVYRLVSGFDEPDAMTTIGFSAPAVFDGAWFAGLQGATVTFSLYYQGALVATSATLDPAATPTFLSSGYAGLVDHVVVASPGQGSYAMDDFTFTPAVPEPATWALVCAGLGIVGAAARRRRAAP